MKTKLSFGTVSAKDIKKFHKQQLLRSVVTTALTMFLLGLIVAIMLRTLSDGIKDFNTWQEQERIRQAENIMGVL
jgi:hypothetical protein